MGRFAGLYRMWVLSEGTFSTALEQALQESRKIETRCLMIIWVSIDSNTLPLLFCSP